MNVTRIYVQAADYVSQAWRQGLLPYLEEDTPDYAFKCWIAGLLAATLMVGLALPYLCRCAYHVGMFVLHCLCVSCMVYLMLRGGGVVVTDPVGAASDA